MSTAVQYSIISERRRCQRAATVDGEGLYYRRRWWASSKTRRACFAVTIR